MAKAKIDHQLIAQADAYKLRYTEQAHGQRELARTDLAAAREFTRGSYQYIEHCVSLNEHLARARVYEYVARKMSTAILCAQAGFSPRSLDFDDIDRAKKAWDQERDNKSKSWG